jgi:hypothetical protein
MHLIRDLYHEILVHFVCSAREQDSAIMVIVSNATRKQSLGNTYLIGFSINTEHQQYSKHSIIVKNTLRSTNIMSARRLPKQTREQTQLQELRKKLSDSKVEIQDLKRDVEEGSILIARHEISLNAQSQQLLLETRRYNGIINDVEGQLRTEKKRVDDLREKRDYSLEVTNRMLHRRDEKIQKQKQKLKDARETIKRLQEQKDQKDSLYYPD